MLQRTRADLVVPVYVDTIRRYPTAAALADAPIDDLRDQLRPLGFAHRVGRISAAADACRDGVPATVKKLEELPGVGPYAAHATACFAYGRQVAVVDPSVVRIMDRLGIAKSTRSRPRSDASVWRAAAELLPARRARIWNFAVLDLGALVCRPRPRCHVCPLQSVCPSARLG